MDARSALSSEFGPEQELAFALSGTVAIPSPFPAMGQVSVLVVPETQVRKEHRDPRFFLKSVQVVNVQCVVTRIIARNAVRAIGYYSDGESESKDGEWTVVPTERLSQMLATANHAAKELEKDRGRSFELPLFEKAVLYVPESAPVLHRIEFGLTAAVSAVAPVPLVSDHDDLGCCC